MAVSGGCAGGRKGSAEVAKEAKQGPGGDQGEGASEEQASAGALQVWLLSACQDELS